ncbi:MAG TPA: carbamoyl-phosphate synthase domain-containing protein, partial [Patescibacteria group bacterium]
MNAKLILKDGEIFEGQSFGYEQPSSGELVFSTGMVGYPESLTDPSYQGQILVFTYPIIGSYGVPNQKYWESSSIHVSGLIVSQYIDTPSHFHSQMSLGEWLKKEKIPGLVISDTRYITQKLRDKGTQLAKIIFDTSTSLSINTSSTFSINFDDSNKKNLVAAVSTLRVSKEGQGIKTVVLIDCGVKENIRRCLINRGVRLITVPWNFNIF